jgi:hypothetical protein
MSTTTTTPAAAPTTTSPRGRTALVAVSAAVAGAAVVAGLVFGLGGFGASAATTLDTPTVVPSSVVPASGSGSAAHAGGSTGHHVTPVSPVAPSAAIETLQRGLAG